VADLGGATVVVGTAGHIDHGKTTLLRALTGIDADRLPEERERGMTIDVGFAHLDIEDGTTLDFVDVPGHDRLVGNMLVGAGEVDAALIVVAADDGPRAQTLEHLELLDALDLRRGVVAITKVDAVEPARVAEVEAEVRALVGRTTLAGAPVAGVSAVTGDGLPTLRRRLVELRDAVNRDWAVQPAGPLRLPIDRAFTVRGRGTVVTGTLRGGSWPGDSLRAGTELRLEPSDERRLVRVREVQVHHGRADVAAGGRTALNLVGLDATELRRGQVLAAGAGIVASDRLLVTLRRSVRLRGGGEPGGGEPGGGGSVAWPPRHRAGLRLHLWTESVDATVDPAGPGWLHLEGSRERVVAILRLGHPIAVLVGARAVLRDPGSSRVVAGVTVLDSSPPRGASRRRATPARLGAVASVVAAHQVGEAPAEAVATALVDLHGFRDGGLAPDVAAELEAAALGRVGDGLPIADLRTDLGRELRRHATVDRASRVAASAAVDRVIEGLATGGHLAREGDRLIEPSRRAVVGDALAGAMARLESQLDVNVPPSLAEAARAAGCPPEGLRQLEASGRIVRVEDDLAWSATRYATLRDLALGMARRGPLAPAAFRDAIGGNRRVALALLEDLGRRGFLRRTDAGHVLGPRA
jgi:selenocysteine-specific elongation factor